LSGYYSNKKFRQGKGKGRAILAYKISRPVQERDLYKISEGTGLAKKIAKNGKILPAGMLKRAASAALSLKLNETSRCNPDSVVKPGVAIITAAETARPVEPGWLLTAQRYQPAEGSAPSTC